MSVYAAISAKFVKVPAEKSLYALIKYIREMLDERVITALAWLDARDMCSDGLTKGIVDRQALPTIMAGMVEITRQAHIWQALQRVNQD